MCQLARVNSVFVTYISCEEGKQLRQAKIEARRAYLNYKENDQTPQALYDAYETARVAYDKHLEETQA